MHMHVPRGFTLLELLIVIAIIGLLAAITLASIGSSRAKGTDAAIKSNLNAVRTQIELHYVNNGNNYGSGMSINTCPLSGSTMFYTNVAVRKAIEAIESVNGADSVLCVLTSGRWAVQSPLVSGGYWCIDSRGVGRFSGALLTTNTCP
jgi:prepilin-type N-terminal cleavage/methylation domain-containing protein